MWREQTFEHRQRPPACFVTFFTGTAFLAGAVALILKPLSLVPVIALGFAAPAFWRYFGANQTIICTPDGFSIIRESRRGGTSRADHRWDEVTATRYRESIFRSNSRRQRIGYFSAQTARGQAFEVDEEMSGFGQLIDIFNSMTPQLPYIWQEHTELPFTSSAVITCRNRYRQMQRDQGA